MTRIGAVHVDAAVDRLGDGAAESEKALWNAAVGRARESQPILPTPDDLGLNEEGGGHSFADAGILHNVLEILDQVPGCTEPRIRETVRPWVSFLREQWPTPDQYLEKRGQGGHRPPALFFGDAPLVTPALHGSSLDRFSVRAAEKENLRLFLETVPPDQRSGVVDSMLEFFTVAKDVYSLEPEDRLEDQRAADVRMDSIVAEVAVEMNIVFDWRLANQHAKEPYLGLYPGFDAALADVQRRGLTEPDQIREAIKPAFDASMHLLPPKRRVKELVRILGNEELPEVARRQAVQSYRNTVSEQEFYRTFLELMKLRVWGG
ncbi:hypothetical protein [Inquilinus sp. OTU3971]|uniref:hypothetical protein n=1 Tax=Inquilinus sp. OTU3971 TaxID=3043855 RepID=UPI00313E9979